MKNALVRHVLRVLILCLGTLPFNVHAGLITTDQVAAAAPVADGRETLRTFIDRGEVRAQLHSLGVSPAAAQARVDAMTDGEIAGIAGRIERLPAGGFSTAAAIAGLIVVELIWFYWVK